MLRGVSVDQSKKGREEVSVIHTCCINIGTNVTTEKSEGCEEDGREYPNMRMEWIYWQVTVDG